MKKARIEIGKFKVKDRKIKITSTSQKRKRNARTLSTF